MPVAAPSEWASVCFCQEVSLDMFGHIARATSGEILNTSDFPGGPNTTCRTMTVDIALVAGAVSGAVESLAVRPGLFGQAVLLLQAERCRYSH